MMTSYQSTQIKFSKPLLRDLVRQLQQKQRLMLPPKQKQVMVNPEDIRKFVKKSWKDGGFGNKQFGDLKPLRGKVLTEWESQRMPLSKRSFTTPKNFKSYKFDSHSRPFTIKYQKKQFSEKFLQYLKKTQTQYQKTLFQPKHLETINEEVRRKKLNTPRMKFRQTGSSFGMTCSTKSPNGFKTVYSEVLNRKRQL